MADYNMASDDLVKGFSGLAKEMVAKIKEAVGGKVVKVITEIPDDVSNLGDNLVVSIGKGFKGDINKVAKQAKLIDGSQSDKALEIDTSDTNPNAAEAPAADKIIIGSKFDEKLKTGNDNQAIDGLDGNDSISTGTGADSISGGNGNDSLSAGAGDDTISTGSGQDSVDGGSGFDIVNVVAVSTKTTFDSKVLTVSDAAGNTAVLEGVQVIQFGNDYNDTQFILDNEKQGAVTRLFEGVFDRKIAVDGLKYWTNAVDAQDGTGVLTQVSNAFINSEEGKAQRLDSMSNADFVNKMFKEFVSRDGVEAGIKFWNEGLDSGGTTKEQVMAEFAQTDEAQLVTQEFVHVIGVKDNDVHEIG
ncbi:MAG: DUF4214 domain-containing protein [Methylococcales bacterium]|nr:DUF4214 domain-containing protein [Methylococcales bacterium]